MATISTDGNKILDARPSTSGNSNTFTKLVMGQVLGYNTINVEFLNPKQQTFQRWLQRSEGAFPIFRIQAEQKKVAYLLHYICVEAFGILCD